MPRNANVKCLLAIYADASYPDVLILVLLYLDTDYADTDADLCIRYYFAV